MLKNNIVTKMTFMCWKKEKSPNDLSSSRVSRGAYPAMLTSESQRDFRDKVMKSFNRRRLTAIIFLNISFVQ
jgi:hypothetical protein